MIRAIRAVAIAAMFGLGPGGVGAHQELGVLRIRVSVVDGERKAVPVPRHALLISDNPPSAAPRRVLTALDGTVDVRLRPGNYTVESDQPFAFDGRGYQWMQMVDVVVGRDASLELTADNAEVAPLAAAAAASGTPLDASSLLAQWQDSVIELWTPTDHASGVVIDPKGLLVTNQRVVGAATSIEVQFSPAVKVAARVLAADAARDVAVLWVDPTPLASLRPVPLGCGEPSKPVVKGQDVVAIEAPFRQRKGTTPGTVESVDARALMSDLVLSSGGAGGPVFTTDGRPIGITSIVDERVGQRQRDARIVRASDICDVVASAEKAMKDAAPPSAGRLPVEPATPYPVDTLKDAVARRAGSTNPYQVSTPDFDISFFTPIVSYAAQARSEPRSRPAPTKEGRLKEVEPALARARMDFANWSEYVEMFPPVVLVRVTPKLVEGFWTRVARGAASTQGVSIPPIKRIRSGFARLRASCGDVEIVPIHPFKLEHRVGETDVVYEGLYVFDPAAFAPECASVTLTIYSEKEPEKGVTQLVEARVLTQIWQDFEAYRSPR